MIYEPTLKYDKFSMIYTDAMTIALVLRGHAYFAMDMGCACGNRMFLRGPCLLAEMERFRSLFNRRRVKDFKSEILKMFHYLDGRIAFYRKAKDHYGPLAIDEPLKQRIMYFFHEGYLGCRELMHKLFRACEMRNLKLIKFDKKNGFQDFYDGDKQMTNKMTNKEKNSLLFGLCARIGMTIKTFVKRLTK